MLWGGTSVGEVSAMAPGGGETEVSKDTGDGGENGDNQTHRLSAYE